MKGLLVFVTVLLLGATVVPANAFSVYPPGGDLQDLPHGRYYIWGINGHIPDGYRIVSASVTFHSIFNWAVEANDRIWLHLLQAAPLGVNYGTDDQASGSWFDSAAYSGEEILLHEFDDLPELWQNRADVTYDFDTGEVNTLNSYLMAGDNMGLGVDPDCHFYNCGVEFSGAIAPIPEPATLLLLGIGLVGVGGMRNRWARKS